MTLNELLRGCAASLQDAGYIHSQREAEIILGHLTGLDTAKLFTRGEEEIDLATASKAEQAVKDRIAGKPIAYIVGTQQFLGWHLKSDARALIPRPETEQLVEFIVKRIRNLRLSKPKILELGTGSGAISIALKKYFPNAEVTATDISEDALELAEDNARDLGVDIDLIQSDLFDAIEPNKYDVIVANLPYVPSERLAFVTDEIIDWEPNVAIEGGEDGFSYIRKFFEKVKPYLTEDGVIGIEMWHTHGPMVQECVSSQLPGKRVEIEQDLAGFDRFAFISS